MTTTTTIQMIPVDLIDPHPHNPRHDIADLGELVKSIKAQGIRQNLLLVAQPARPIGPARYTAVIGHRRLAAAKKAGLKEVPAVVAELTDAEQLELMLVENCQRMDLTVIEEAEGYQGLLDLGLTTATIARKTGRAEKAIQGRVKLLALPDDARAKVQKGQATLEDAAKVAEFEDDPDTMAKLSADLGTHNFEWRISEAKREKKRLADQDVLVEAIKRCGVVEVDPDDPPSRVTGWVEHRIEKVADLNKMMDQIRAGTRFERSPYYAGASVWIPDPDGAIQTAEDAARQAVIQAEADRRQQEATDRTTAEELRKAWVREYVQRAKVSAAHTDAIVASAVAKLLTGSSLWLYSSSKDWDVETIRPVCALLIALVLMDEGAWWDRQSLRDLYALLEQLGYQLSDMERARLTPPAAGGEE